LEGAWRKRGRKRKGGEEEEKEEKEEEAEEKKMMGKGEVESCMCQHWQADLKVGGGVRM